MSNNSINLKQAIQTLNIKKPFDLRAQNSPGLKAPTIVEAALTKHPEVEHVSTESAQHEPTQTESSAKDTRVEALPRKAAVGFFMLAHSVFQNEAIRKLSGDSFRVFIWMSAQAWRFKESSGTFRAAVDYISVGCGCSRSTVTRALNDLKSNRLIECVEQNFKKGNLWKVSRVADGRPTELEQSRAEDAQSKPVQMEAVAESVRPRSVFKMSKEHGQNEQQLISCNKNKNSEENRAEVFEALEEREMIWKKFREYFKTEDEQIEEINSRLNGSPFSSRLKFAQDMAVMQWWEDHRLLGTVTL